MPLTMPKMRRSSRACAKYHPGLCSPFIHSVVFNDSVYSSESPNQTVRMCRLIRPFAILCPKQKNVYAWRGSVWIVQWFRSIIQQGSKLLLCYSVYFNRSFQAMTSPCRPIKWSMTTYGEQTKQPIISVAVIEYTSKHNHFVSWIVSGLKKNIGTKYYLLVVWLWGAIDLTRWYTNSVHTYLFLFVVFFLFCFFFVFFFFFFFFFFFVVVVVVVVVVVFCFFCFCFFFVCFFFQTKCLGNRCVWTRPNVNVA